LRSNETLARLPTRVRKIPYYARSVVVLSRAATLRSIGRSVVLSDKRLDFRDGLSLDLSAVIDLLVVKETLVDDVYGLAVLDVSPGELIVDVGAGVGDFTLAAARRFTQSEVHGFEPNPRAFALLEQNVRRHGAANVRITEIAVGVEESYGMHGLSAGPLATAAGVVAATNDAAVVRAKRLDDLLPERPIALLKIDCEGLELDVLRGAVRALERAQRVVVEYHRHLAADSDRLVVQLLSEQKFETWVVPDRYDDAIGYVHAARVKRNQV
jgi:FkbM family methyltransferase